MRTSTSNLPSSTRDAPRFREVLAHVDAHLDDDLSVERLSRVARSSAFHFHHQFSARFGLAVHQYVTLARLRRAALQLAFRDGLRVVDIAFASGYESPEAFSRAFKRSLGATPSAFRARPDWLGFGALERRLADLRERAGDSSSQSAITIELREPLRLAALEVRARPLRLAEALRSFIAWRRANRLPPSRSATYSLFHGPPGEAEGVDLCAAIDRPVAPNALGVVEKRIPGGRCAVLRHRGTNAGLREAAYSLYERWLPASGETLREGPLVVRRISLFPDVPEHEAESEIFLPLR